MIAQKVATLANVMQANERTVDCDTIAAPRGKTSHKSAHPELFMTSKALSKIAGLASALPPTLFNGLVQAGVSAPVANKIAHLLPTAALFAAFLGYNPMGSLLSAKVLHALPAVKQANLLGHSFFPNLISPPFMIGLHGVFYLSAAMCFVAAIVSLLRGKRYIYEQEES